MINHITEIDSTNSYIRNKIEENELQHGYAVSTDFQHNGHGQKGNNWESECKKNILMSIFLRPLKIKPENQFIITQIVTTAIIDIINTYINKTVEVKWPNDIYVENKKLAGILIENSISGDKITETIIGIGLNVNQTEFIINAPNPISLIQITGIDLNQYKIADEIYKKILDIYSTFENSKKDSLSTAELHKTYMNRLYRRNGMHKYQTAKGEFFMAKVVKIDSYGCIHLMHEDNNIHIYSFKEIKFILDNNFQ